MSMSGEVVLSVDEAVAFAELAQGFDPDAIMSVSGLTAVMARNQHEAVAQQEKLAAGLPVVTEATTFQSSF